MDESKYDKRLIKNNALPEGYESYIKSLPCCACGGIALCNCTIKDFNDNQANSADAKSRAAD